MNRDENLDAVRRRSGPWDIVVIGGGATGAGCALDAASRGYSVLLLERHDFGKGTSSRSTKLIHGGVRYLRQGDISLVRESLRERGRLLANAPHVVHKQEFVIPCYTFWEKIFYGVGMKVYDMLAGRYSIGRSRIIDRGEVLERLRNIDPRKLAGGVLYYDAQFDDTRLLIDILRTASAQGAVAINYARVVSLRRSAAGRCCPHESAAGTGACSGCRRACRAAPGQHASGRSRTRPRPGTPVPAGGRNWRDRWQRGCRSSDPAFRN